MHELIPLRLWTFTMLGMLALAISVPGQTPPSDANSQARAALALAVTTPTCAAIPQVGSRILAPVVAAGPGCAVAQKTPPPTGSAQDAPPAKNDYSFNVKKMAAPACDCGCDKQQECTCEHCVAGPDSSPYGTYADFYRISIETNSPLIVFVGRAARPIPRLRSCWVDELPGAKAPCIVVAAADGQGGLLRLADLPPDATNEQIRRVLEQAQTPIPPIQKPAFRPSVQQRGGNRGC